MSHQDQIYLNRYDHNHTTSFFSIFSCCTAYDDQADRLVLPKHLMLNHPNKPSKPSKPPSRAGGDSRGEPANKSAWFAHQPHCKDTMKRSLHQEMRPNSYKMPSEALPPSSSFPQHIASRQTSLNSTDLVRSSQDSFLRFPTQQQPKFNFRYPTTPTPVSAPVTPMNQSLIKPPSQSIVRVAELSDEDADSVANLNKLYGDKELLVSLEMQKKSSSATSKPKIRRLTSHPRFQDHNLKVRQTVSIREPNEEDEEDRESVVITNSLLGSTSQSRFASLLRPIHEVEKESRITQKMALI